MRHILMTLCLLLGFALPGMAQEDRYYPVDSLAAHNVANRVFQAVVLEDKTSAQTMNTIDPNQGYAISVKGNDIHIGVPTTSTGISGGYGASSTGIDANGIISKYRAKTFSSGVAVVNMKVRSKSDTYNVEITVYKDTRCDISVRVGTERFRYGGAIAMGKMPQ